MRRAPSEQCDYVFEGSAADCYIEIHRTDKVKNQIYRGVAQLVARLLWEQDAGGSSPFTPTNNPLKRLGFRGFLMPLSLFFVYCDTNFVRFGV